MQPVYTQSQPVYTMLQQQQPVPQAMFVQSVQPQQQQIMQPAPVPGVNQMVWMQGGGYGAANQWQG